ncbi:MAG: helix-turn-helix domain-containing protein [Kofleriaceae bacterium]|nr:helix-turn-helix domain-containing protein [Kofleriaceae bacterium]MCL4225980.1 helix-turn-helix domain-containing protein [Myxococcales bacterium]
MRKPYERGERAALIRAVQEHGEAVPTAAARLGVGLSTAYRWMRSAPATRPAPMFIEVVPERERAAPGPACLRVRVGGAEIEVQAGFDARLLREVVEALGGDA